MNCSTMGKVNAHDALGLRGLYSIVCATGRPSLKMQMRRV